ncbi:hypothetical protein C8J57DRAFT_1720052 [Mycena rebaudengoi]|nr:hypothetical protein C8J57DRAFT_1720052 [Mycena rebaudengoi]
MDPTSPPLTDQSYDNSVTSSGHPVHPVTSSGLHDHPVTWSGHPDHPVTPSGYHDTAVSNGPGDTPPVDVAALLAANQELTALVNNMRIGYNTEMQAEMAAFQAAVQDDFTAVQTQRDTARNESKLIAMQMAATIARLERLESPQAANPTTPHRTRDPRVRPQSVSSKAMSPPPPHAQVDKAKAKHAPATPAPAQQSRSSKTPRHSSSPKGSEPAKPPRSSRVPPERPPASTPPRSSHKQPSSSSKASGSSSKKSGTPRRIAEHQMLKGDIDAEAQSFKTTFQTHLRFLAGSLDSSQAPPSASPEVVQQFERRFDGLTVTELKRIGQLGHPVISPSQVKLGISVEDFVRTKNRIVRSFFKLEEGALLHIKAYLAKLGIIKWAVDFTQSPYSMYNMAMRMAAIDTFRFCVAGTYYDFLHPDTRYIKDSALLVRLYDHFEHRYMFDKWMVEIRTPGGNEINTERNKVSQARIRLHGLRAEYLKGAKVPKGLKLLFSAKATSDDEGTSNGRPQALARAERSQGADQVIRAVEGLMVQDLIDDGKTRSANNRKRRLVPAFGQRNPGYFQEVPKEMPIQYYDPDWFNNRPPQARAKIAPKLIIVFAPGSTDFFSRRGENALPVEELTQKYGAAVFEQYDLDFGAGDANESTDGADQTADTDDEGEGDSVGSQDSDEDIELSDAGSIASFISNDDSGSDDDEDGMADHAAGDEDNQQDGDWDGTAQFAAAYDIDMNENDDEQQIFGDGSSDSD